MKLKKTKSKVRLSVYISTFIFILVLAGCQSSKEVAKSDDMDMMQDKEMAHEMITAMPIPESAYGMMVPQDKGYIVEDLGDGLYWVTEGVYQIIFLTTGEGVIVVDAPPSMGDKILAAIAEVTDEPITHVIYSHSHADHIAAASMYPAGATYIAHEATAGKLSAQEGGARIAPYGAFLGGSPVPKPTVTFKESYTLNVGNQKLELTYRGANHNEGNIFIYAPKQKVLMFVDVIFPGWTPFKYLAITENVTGFIASHDDVLSFDFKTLVSGHLGRRGSREDVETQKEYIYDVRANAAVALQTVDFMAVAEKTGWANSWLLFDTYLNEVSQMCTDSTVVKWGGVLGAVDVFTWDHCWKMAETLRVD